MGAEPSRGRWGGRPAAPRSQEAGPSPEPSHKASLWVGRMYLGRARPVPVTWSLKIGAQSLRGPSLPA